MIITYNKSIPQWAKPKIDIALSSAVQWLKIKYPHVNFEIAQVNFSMTRNGSNYHHEALTASIAVHNKMRLYNKKSVGLTTPNEGLAVGYVINTACAIIHELTHFVQGVEKRKYSEVETTQNEINYLKVADPYWYSRLVKTSSFTKKNKELVDV